MSFVEGQCDLPYPEGGTQCTIPEACNYLRVCDPSTCATCDEATLCDLSCVVQGCTDSGACNFDVTANQEDGSCEYCSCTIDSSLFYSLVIEEHAVAAERGPVKAGLGDGKQLRDLGEQHVPGRLGGIALGQDVANILPGVRADPAVAGEVDAAGSTLSGESAVH